uniref:Inositol-pentakisphosphate 2-kinase n=1 Tax=Neolamprologus brichardi TaxID=32507 RepID=A0A3Q4H4T7_NEOBR
MELDKMDENDWKYHGEGNKSLVVSHVQHPRVLRLLKYPAEDSENPPQIQNIVDFSSNVMSSLLGEKFIHSGEVVKLPLEFVRQLSIKVQHQRPAWRCDKVMDIYSGCALCLPNLTSPALHQPTHTPPLCIEIKPKCGFLPSPKHVSKDIKTKVCRYCMHQHYKVANGKWKRRSFYCPLDLFSGNRQRMHFAIKHLIEEPQNNFKVFKEGSDESPDMNSLLHHLRPYFLHANNRINSHVTRFAMVRTFLFFSGADGTDCDLPPLNTSVFPGSRGLPSDSVLFRILQTQMLDTLDIEGLYPLYRQVEQHLQDFPKERTRLQIEGPYNEAFLEKLQKCPAEDDGSVEYAVAKVHQYRVAMTAKDCSIMVALVQRQLRDFRPPAFSYSASILDLDPKPFDSIPRQLRLDQKIVTCYLRTGGALPKGPVREKEDCTLLFHPM